MARLLRIERAIRWMAKVLTANRDALPFPDGITDQINPVIDVFGSQRMGELQFATVAGGAGNIEITHGPVPEESIRFYLSMEYSSDDPTARRLKPGRVIPTDTGFPFAAIRDDVLGTAGEFFTVRNFAVGPGAFAAAQVPAIALGAQLTITVVWIETPLGEYLRSIQ